MVQKKKQQKGVHKVHSREKEPEYTIQINDPTTLRKDILESLREVILFMQGYEQLRKIQEEKMMFFTKLKAEIRELNTLIESKLKRNFPPGKHKQHPKEESPKTKPEQLSSALPASSTPTVPPQVPQPVFSSGSGLSSRSFPLAKKEVPAPEPEHRELDELEQQLKEIEAQLNSLQ